MPVSLDFTSSGAVPDSWTDVQWHTETGMITWSNGTTSYLPGLTLPEMLSYQATGVNADFFDAPGLAQYKPGTFGRVYVVSANLTWSFSLTAYAASGTQVANCGTVDWSATLNWTTVNGKPIANGGVVLP